ncbi:MAG: bifunctional riboflavin kinase/FAD synthetase [Anaerolineaceae bacterium]|nr:bifunctional riboflavin kinase/FAD synthetase [Anaerolineaceae bacterium]
MISPAWTPTSLSMQHFHSLEELKRVTLSYPAIDNAWVTIGSFDGVHRGHQAILKLMVKKAHAAAGFAVVVTFYPHPIVVLRGATESIYLNSPEERAHLLGKLGIDIVLTLPFDPSLAQQTAEEFMHNLSAAIGIRQLWVGDDFALGRNRQGNVNELHRIGDQLGYKLHIVNKVTDGNKGERISSSRIREILRAGKAAEAARLLGYPYSVEGPVIHGDGRGRGLGFPTLNVGYWPGKIVPLLGVYATWTWVGERRLPSVTSVGVRPTFDNPPAAPRVEAFLIDHDQDLYGQEVRVEFLEFLRPELRFDSVQDLIDQMIIDTQNAREVLAHAS